MLNRTGVGEIENCFKTAAPMPGTIATVNVGVGTQVTQGDLLVTIEAMKMETSVRAERSGVIGEVVTKPGEAIDAKDLLFVLN